jgi:hypothetical protein
MLDLLGQIFDTSIRKVIFPVELDENVLEKVRDKFADVIGKNFRQD